MKRTVTRRYALRALSATAVVGAIGATAACSDGGALWQDGTEKNKEPDKPKAGATISSPPADAKDVPASIEFEYATTSATSSTFEVKDSAGKVLTGKLRPGSTIWVPDATLGYGATYTATVAATGDDGKTVTTVHSFTTMAKPANTVRVSTNIGDNMVVGIGMPMVLRLSRAIPKDKRADIEKRLWVVTSPVQEGSWHWFSDTELHYRPRAFWKAGTKLDFRIATGGVPLGGNWFGRADVTVDATVRPDALIMIVDNVTKQMSVSYKGSEAKKLPVSLGKPKTPSSSGTMVVMERLRKTVFDTRTDPDPENRYLIDIEYAQRITWGGEFIHAAPWSVGDQGRRNVSHGCLNVSVANAAWLFNLTKVGDPITVKGTERVLQRGNGWTDWSLPWDEYIKGSAIPYSPPAPPAAAPGASTSPSATP